jgi:hypothetical protein
MSVTTDILQSWVHPRLVFRRRLGDGPREDRALAVLMVACGLIFVARWPGLAREAQLSTGQPDAPGLQTLLGINLFALLFMAPVIFYALAGLAHLAARALGGQGSGFSSRMALFWALLAVAPLMLLQGLVAGFIGQGAALTLTGALVGLGFLALWLVFLHEAHRKAQGI